MKIGLIDADLMWQKRANGRRYGKTKADIFPNLALMTRSAGHKPQGAEVEWSVGLKHSDRVYVSKVFSTTPESTDMINADEVIGGGSCSATMCRSRMASRTVVHSDTTASA